MMTSETAQELKQIVEQTAAKLKNIDTTIAQYKPNPAKWSIKEIIGHLIDSAANNHQRFIRAQQADMLTFPGYDQDIWVRVQGYNETSWNDLIDLWRLYNLHLAQVIERIPENKLETECKIGSYDPATLKYLVSDYVVHLKHHLDQIEERIA